MVVATPLESRPGSYILWLRLTSPRSLQIGRLARADFPAGLYAYVGSAFGPGGVRARLGRHLSDDKRLRWHIDYLRDVARLESAWISYDTTRHEHTWAGTLAAAPAVEIPLFGFGASDCNCKTHLLAFKRPLPLSEFLRCLPSPAPPVQQLLPVL